MKRRSGRIHKVEIKLSDQEYEALKRLVEWRRLNTSDVLRGLIMREAEVALHLSPLQVDSALGTAFRNPGPESAIYLEKVSDGFHVVRRK